MTPLVEVVIGVFFRNDEVTMIKRHRPPSVGSMTMFCRAIHVIQNRMIQENLGIEKDAHDSIAIGAKNGNVTNATKTLRAVKIKRKRRNGIRIRRSRNLRKKFK